MSIETDIVIFIVKSFSFEWWWLDNKEVLVVMVRRFSGVPHSYIDKVVYACALSGYLLTLKHISDKRKVMKEKANGLPCLFKIQSKCASFLSNETTESKKNTLASYKVLLFGNITLMRFSCSIVFSKWKISILFIYKMRIYFEDPVSRSIMLFVIDFAKFWIYHIVCHSKILILCVFHVEAA